MKTISDADKAFQPIGNESIVNKIIDRIIQSIADGVFRPGDKLPSEYELINDLNVGRNSLREAMKILSTLGVVTIRRGDGTYICSEVSPNAFDSTIYSLIFEGNVNKEMLELRRILDREAMFLAIDKGTDDEIDALTPYLSLIRSAYEQNNIEKAAYLDNQFHLAIAEMTKNPYLIRILAGVYKIFSISIADVNSSANAFQETELCHKKTIECLRSRDKSAVEDIISFSLTGWED